MRRFDAAPDEIRDAHFNIDDATARLARYLFVLLKVIAVISARFSLHYQRNIITAVVYYHYYLL